MDAANTGPAGGAYAQLLAALQQRMGGAPQVTQGAQSPGAIFEALNDLQKSAVTQTAGGSRKQMPGIAELMQRLQASMPPEQYRALMEDQLKANETPAAQLMRMLKLK